MYLTDGVFLYRVVGPAPGGASESVELEDCYGLDVVRVSVAQLRERRLRVVTPERSALTPAEARERQHSSSVPARI